MCNDAADFCISLLPIYMSSFVNGSIFKKKKRK